MVTERTARRLSPLLYLVVALCFLLPFASASSNTGLAKQAAAQLQRAGVAPDLVAELTACLDALNGRAFARYSGITLAVGSDPSSTSERVEACSAGKGAPALSAKGGNIGVQGLVAAALALTMFGLILGIAPFRARGLVLAILSGIAAVLLFLSENHLQPTIADRVSAVPELVSVSAGIGFWLVMGLLIVAALYNSAATILDGGADRRPRG